MLDALLAFKKVQPGFLRFSVFHFHTISSHKLLRNKSNDFAKQLSKHEISKYWAQIWHRAHTVNFKHASYNIKYTNDLPDGVARTQCVPVMVMQYCQIVIIYTSWSWWDGTVNMIICTQDQCIWNHYVT